MADVGKKVQYDYTVHDFESDNENITADLEQLEYPYNQEVTHQVVWSSLDDYLAPAGIEQATSAAADQQPPVAKAAINEDDSVDYPYNQYHGALPESYELLGNGLWKEATEDDENGKQEEALGLSVDYPYNQLFGQDASDFPVLSGYYENAASERWRDVENASTSTPVEHTVHTVEFPDFDDVELASPPPPRHHFYPAFPAAVPASTDHRRQHHHQQPRRSEAQEPAMLPPKIGDHLTAEVDPEKAQFVPVPAALVDTRHHRPARQTGADSDSRDANDPSDSNVGQRRQELAKQGADSVDYVESFADIKMAPEDKVTFTPTGQKIRYTLLLT